MKCINRNILIRLGVGAELLVTSWTALIVLAKRLPPGLARELVASRPKSCSEPGRESLDYWPG